MPFCKCCYLQSIIHVVILCTPLLNCLCHIPILVFAHTSKMYSVAYTDSENEGEIWNLSLVSVYGKNDHNGPSPSCLEIMALSTKTTVCVAKM